MPPSVRIRSAGMFCTARITGYTFELFVPYSVFGTDEISDYRIAAGVRSRANIPGGTETAFGAWSAAEQAAFTGVSPAQWVALADAL